MASTFYNQNHPQLAPYSVQGAQSKKNQNLDSAPQFGGQLNSDNIASLRSSAKYIPKEGQDAFANFLQLQAQQGVSQPADMLKSVAQYNQQQEQQQQLQVINQVEGAFMKRLDFSKSNHPTACFFHLIFKACAFICHLILSFFMDSLKIHYVTILFCTMDFWIVKNISGRLLIGLRWWSECQQDNSTRWVFECKINKGDINNFNFNVFWSLQIITNVLWAVLLIVNVIGVDLGDSAVCAYGLFTSFWNTYYFYKCNTKQKEGLSKLAAEMQSDLPLNFMHGSVRFPL